MLAARRLLLQNLLLSRPHSSSPITTLTRGSPRTRAHANGVPPRGALDAPWAAFQRRTKFLGADVRSGNVIERKGRVYQVIKAEHTQQGRGGATIQVELRDLDSGNKVTERFRTNEPLERVFAEEKSYTFLYADGDTITLMEPDTFEQLDVSRELFGKSAVYLQDEMTVKLQLCDGKVMSASVPHRVTCTVVQAPSNSKGLHATPQYKKVVLDNGLTVDAPPFVKPGERIVINTTDDSYMTRAKE